MITILSRAQELREGTVKHRRDFHSHPELGFSEVRTAGIIAAELRQLGYAVREGVGKTGVVGLLQGENPGRCVMLRFDMDALPITEETGAEYASLNPGKMHACGHDGHVSIGLTVARILREQQTSIAGRIKLVFQPAEEGLGGAEAMIADQVLENPLPDAAFGLHLWNEHPAGWMAVKDGPFMAGADMFRIQIKGRGGHGAMPQAAIDPIMAGAQLVTAIQSIVSRNISPLDSAVISITSFHTGTSYNIIPETVEMLGTVRTFTPEVRRMIHNRMQTLIDSVCMAFGCSGELEFINSTPPVVNAGPVTEIVRKAASDVVPEYRIDSNYQSTVSEDMAIFLQHIPGCFFFIGSAPEDTGLRYGHHHPKFDIDENVLPVASAIIAQAALIYLKAFN